MNQAWNFKQTVSLRASTMLLLYLAVLLLIAFTFDRLHYQPPLFVHNFMGASFNSAPIILVAVFVFSLAFFINSTAKKSPQFQFLAEAIIALVSFIAMPVY